MKRKISLLIFGLLFTACGGDLSSSHTTNDTSLLATTSSILENEERDNIEESERIQNLDDNKTDIAILKYIGVDTALYSVTQKKLGYTFELRSDSKAPTTPAKTSIAIWGKTSVTGDEIINLEAHNGYADGTHFQVVVKEGDKVIGASDEVEFSADVGDLEFSDIDVGEVR